MIYAGRLDQRVTLQQKSVTRDDIGGEVVTWVDVATLWAAVQPVRGREYIALRAAQSDITTKITIRYRSGVTTAMRIVWNGHAMDIAEAININGGNHTLELMCRGEALDA